MNSDTFLPYFMIKMKITLQVKKEIGKRKDCEKVHTRVAGVYLHFETNTMK